MKQKVIIGIFLVKFSFPSKYKTKEIKKEGENREKENKKKTKKEEEDKERRRRQGKKFPERRHSQTDFTSKIASVSLLLL